ncbi:metallophosphoesterase family protein [Neptunicella marina]|uniref:Metallophosphoesterase n=1 Tax=Neptunicella marina TaxID=2125989 RepID=A0A8J6ISX9_9ALTE|nr:metallophosphoesterase [Neptunicella marina]MBC3764863.1 metallophosphoesterase [Neptunicella marina]
MSSLPSYFTIAQISDCHLFADTTRAGYEGINPFVNLSNVCELVVSHRPKLLLVTGDISQDHSRESYLHLQKLRQQYLPDSQLVVLPGNHDDCQLMQEIFAPEQLWLATPFEVQNWQLHCLNSQYQGTQGQVESKQLNALEQQVSVADDAHHLIAVHHHPIKSESWLDKHNWVNRQEFVTRLEKLKGVKAVVHGHIHAATEKFIAQVPVWSCPSTCWQWQLSEDFGVSDLSAGARIITCHSDGTIESGVVRI